MCMRQLGLSRSFLDQCFSIFILRPFLLHPTLSTATPNQPPHLIHQHTLSTATPNQPPHLIHQHTLSAATPTQPPHLIPQHTHSTTTPIPLSHIFYHHMSRLPPPSNFSTITPPPQSTTRLPSYHINPSHPPTDSPITLFSSHPPFLHHSLPPFTLTLISQVMMNK